MTKLLAELIKKVENLPPEIQDEIDKHILEDIENELRWQETLAQSECHNRFEAGGWQSYGEMCGNRRVC